MKQIIKSLLYRPRGLAMGKGSVIRLPRTLHNRAHIKIGSDTRIGPDVILNAITQYQGLEHFGNIAIGDNVYIGSRCQIHSMRQVEIGTGCVLSDYVYLNDAEHGLDPRDGPIMKQRLRSRGPVLLGSGVFLGFGSVVLSGVTLGDHCVVAARSVVTRSFPSYSMVAGSPARLVKNYNRQSGQWECTTGQNELLLNQPL